MSLSGAKIRRRVSLVKRTISALISTVVVVVFLTTLGAAQTQRQLEEKYPKVNAYLVRPNILLLGRSWSIIVNPNGEQSAANKKHFSLPD